MNKAIDASTLTVLNKTADPLWFKDAVIYQLHVKAYMDGNNDGVGDFIGLAQKLDYLSDMGVTALWLLPFYPSPLRDDGYDIADYRGVHPSYGTMENFRRFVDAAHARGMRVITELVINHTSDQHPWFQRARSAPAGSPERDFYVWSDSNQGYQGTRIIFLDTEKSNWTWDDTAQAYFWHRFYSHQPDLNFDNPAVLDEVLSVMNFWLEAGVDGMRLDAVPYLIEREGTNNENLPETHDILKRIRAEIDARFPGRMLLAEANQWPEDVLPYFGNGDECHMAFHFPLMPRIYMSIAQEDRHPVTDIMRQTPDLPEGCQWAIFLRNHDELTLEMVTDKERDYLWNTYASDRRARINLGIRRRLAPLMGNDRLKIELMNALLLSLPGTPVIYYGDEIGMGDNIYLGDRDGVRTPMQWSPDRNGGFSRSDPARLYLPAIMDPVHGYGAVNVEAQLASPSSLLHWTRRMLAIRQAQNVFGRGTLEFLYPTNRKVLAYLRSFEGRTVLCIFNLSRSAQAAQLDLSKLKGHTPVELLGSTAFPPIGELPYLVTLPGYGFFWFVLANDGEVTHIASGIPEPMPEIVTLVTRGGWRDMLTPPARTLLEKEALPAFLARQRWFAAKNDRIATVQVSDACQLPNGQTFVLAQLDVTLQSGGMQRYMAPLAITAEPEIVGAAGGAISYMIAQVRRGPKLEGIYDGPATRAFALALLKGMIAGGDLSCGETRVHVDTTPALQAMTFADDVEVRRLGADQSNSSVLVGNQVVLKVYRRLVPGIHPEIEFGAYLRDVGYANTPPLLASAVFVDRAGEASGLAIAQSFVRNQGDGWTQALDHVQRALETTAVGTPAEAPETPDAEIYLASIATLGRRIAELHKALATPTENADFAPEPINAADVNRWRGEARTEAETAFARVAAAVPNLNAAQRPEAEALLARQAECLAAIDRMPIKGDGMPKTRVHGDLHLGQVLVVQNDWYVIDFEGEPAKDLGVRRRKHSPLKDVAGMLRSFDYAAQAALQRSAVTSANAASQVEHALAWRDAACSTFLEAYRAEFPQADDSLLQLFLLEKACYEISYEAGNRPEWLGIPVRGVLTILDGLRAPGR